MPTLPVPDPKGPPPVVVFVYASPRSGTTLFGDLLGLHPQVRYAGELNRLPLRLATSRGKCACRQPYLDCAFWQQIRDAPGALVGHRRGDDVEQARPAEIRRQAVRPGALLLAWMRRPTAAQRPAAVMASRVAAGQRRNAGSDPRSGAGPTSAWSYWSPSGTHRRGIRPMPSGRWCCATSTPRFGCCATRTW